MKYTKNGIRVLTSNGDGAGAEKKFQSMMVKRGWEATKHGWPDFFCSRNGKIMLVEVKNGARTQLSEAQRLILAELAKYGVPCYRWSAEEEEFEEIKEKQNE